MQGVSRAMAAGLAFAAMAQAAGAGPRAEATGNWAGSAGGGFHFRATLEGVEDRVTLVIRNGIDAVPPAAAEPELVVPDFALSAFATNRLEVAEGPEGSTLQVVTDFADETGEGREVVSLRFIDFQFTVTGYAFRLAGHLDNGTRDYGCEVDLLAGTVTEDGRTRALPPMDVAALNASGWRHDAAFTRGWCDPGG